MNLGKALKKLAIRLHRTSRSDLERGGAAAPSRDYFKIGLIVACVVPFLAIYGVPVFQVINEWRTLKLEVRIPSSDWKVLYLQPEAAPEVVASSINPQLWSSVFHRGDPKHSERLKQTEGKEFWVGTVLTAEQLHSASVKQANIFILGRIGGSFHLWIDGVKYMSGSRRDATPIEIALPFERLAEARPLHVAVQILNDAHHPFPDYFNGYAMGEGLATRTQYSIFSNYDRFVTGTRRYGLMLLNFSFAIFFLFLWSASPIKQEYFFIGFYSLLSGVGQMKTIELLFSRLMPETNAFTDVVLRFMEGSFAMLLGFAYSRLRNDYLKIAAALCFIPPAIAFFLPQNIAALFSLNEWVAGVYIPFCGILGAASCLLQAWYLHAERHRVSFLPLRMKRLFYFSAGLMAFSVIYRMQASGIVAKFQLSHWHRLSHFLLMGFLGRIVFNEYKDQGRLLEKTPVSVYHRRTDLPAQLWGVLLSADLKSSEFFFRHRAEQNPTGHAGNNVVTLWRSHFCTTVLRHGGTIVGQKGDEVTAFFDQQQQGSLSAESRAFQCAKEMAISSMLLEDDLKAKGAYPPGAPSLKFRCAIVQGAIRPIWEELGGGERIPYWEEAANTTPFVELARIMEFEKTVPETKDRSLLVVEDLIGRKLIALNCFDLTQQLHKDLKRLDKHQRAYVIHIVDLSPAQKSAQVLDLNRKKSA